jgi:hypothetical protein
LGENRHFPLEELQQGVNADLRLTCQCSREATSGGRQRGERRARKARKLSSIRASQDRTYWAAQCRANTQQGAVLDLQKSIQDAKNVDFDIRHDNHEVNGRHTIFTFNGVLS